MKKVKTFLASIMIILATAVLTACSCSGNDGGTDNTPQIPVSAITITSDFEGAKRDAETGYINITCSQNDEFNITYSLAPDNTTRTQVDWDFEGNDSVVVVKKNYYSYSQGISHTITFVAKNEGSTVIKFKPKNTDKWTQANVIVGKAKSVWPSFVAPTGLRYNSTTGKVVWNQVSKMKLHTGEEVNVTTNGGAISGLSGYIVSYRNVTTGEEYTTPYNQPISACEYELPRGYTYEINVYARGDDFSMKDSPVSNTFRFHQLATVSNLTNNNGEISFESPEYAEQNRISYLATNQSKYITEMTDGKKTVSFIAGERFEKADRYTISVVSYPANYANATVENGETFVYNEGDKTRYYASAKSSEIVVENLVAPTITVSPVRGVNSVQGIDFGQESSINNPYLSTLLTWKIANKDYSDIHQIKYAYTISKRRGSEWIKITPASAEFAVGTSFDLSQLTPSNEQYKITVYAYGNPNTTIASSSVDLFFHLQSAMNVSMTQTNETTIISNTTLTTVTANAPLYGIDLYFINKNDTSKSVYKFFSGADNGNYQQKQMSVDIAGLNLKAGEYDIYGRFVGINSGKDNISSVGQLSKLNNNTVIVASPVENVQMTSGGILSFTKVSGIEDYQINFTQTQMIDGVRTTDTFASVINSDQATITVDVYELIKEHLLRKENVDSDNLEETFKDYTSNSSISLTITSIGLDQVGVNSAPTNALQFSRHNVVDKNTITLNYDKLSFVSPNNSATYVVEIGGRRFVTPMYNSGATVEVDLKNAKITTEVEAEKNTNLIDYVNKSNITSIKIWALGGGAKANGSGIGYVDSYAITKDFKCSSKVTLGSIKMNAEKLMWCLDEDLDTPQEFNLAIYTKTSGNWRVEKTINIKDIISAVEDSSDEGDDGGDEELESQSLSAIKYYIYDISNAISDIPADTNIAITITHVVSDRFTNVESEKYYLIQLPQVQVNRCLDGTTPSITYSSQAGITYKLIITSTADNAQVGDAKTYRAESSDSTRIIHLSDLGLTGVENVGSYKISIYAYKELEAEMSNAETNPYALSALPGEVNIDVVNNAIIVNANDENISWNTLNSSTSYYMEYKTPTGNYQYVMDAEEHKLFTNDSLTYNVWNLLEVGENKIRITPNADYVNSGVYLVGNLTENVIKKLNTIESSSVTNGLINYTLSDTFENNNYSLSIKIGEEKLLAGEYVIDYESQTISILSSKYIGTKNYSIQITSSGAISSEYSSPISATKVATVSDIEKSNNYIMFTPVSGANIYVLTFEDANGENQVIKRIKYDATTNKIYYEPISEENTASWTEIIDSNIAKFNSGKINLNFYDPMFGIDISNSGIYYYSVTPHTDINGYLNGNISNKYKLAKLSNSLNISIQDESFVLSNYVRSEDLLQTPESISYSIEYSQNVSLDNSKPADGWNNLSWEFDSTKFDENCQVSYIVTFYTVGDSPKEFAQTYLFDSNTHTIQVFKAGEGDTGNTYETQGYLNVTESDNKYIITLDKSQMNSTEVTTALGSTESPVVPDKVRIEYVERKTVYTGSKLFSEVNIEGEGEDGSNSYIINLNTLGLLDAGDYTLKLTFIGNDNEIISSEVKTSEIYSKLPASTLQTVNGVLSWSEIEMASDYTLRITCDPLGTEGDGEEITEWIFENYEYVISEDNPTALPNISEENLKQLNENFLGFETGRNYYIQIMANSNTNLSSKWSDRFTVQKLQAPTNIEIKSTGNTIVNNGQTTYIGEPMLTWSDPNSISNRPNYTMWIGQEERIIDNTTSESGVQTGYKLPSNIMPDTYEISMNTIGNTTSGTDKIGLLTSDRSTQNPQVNYVTETTNVSFENNSFTWVPVAGAYTYKLTFYKGSFSQSDMFATAEKVFTTFTTSNSYSFSSTEFDGVGYFTVLINAYCDPSVAVVSTYAETNEDGIVETYNCTNCTSIYKSPTIEQLMVRDGLISWSLKISDISTFLDVHQSIEGDKLIEYFGENINSTDPDTRRQQLLTSVVSYISTKINNNKKGDAEVDKILTNLYTFNAIINGVETIITPTTVDTINITGTTDSPEYTSVPNPNEAQYLMFKYDLTSVPAEENTPSTSKFVIQISPKGNYADTNNSGLITTVDGKFTSSITVYKPKTPTSVNIDSGDQTIGEIRKQISNGNIYWSLVTTEDSSLDEQFYYHSKYKITAINELSTDTAVEKEVDINDTKEESGNNPNLCDEGVNYFRYLKDLFKDELNNGKILSNTSYRLQINVMGTKDSTVLAPDEKIYLNSNVFEYTDIMNILDNIDSSVTGGQYKYTPCSNISTKTKVYVYGPFMDDNNNNIIYAPDQNDKSTWAWSNITVNGKSINIDYSNNEGKTYNDALTAWKTIITPIWESANEAHWLGEYANLRHIYTFEEKSSSDGDVTSISRTTSLTLTGDSQYNAGSYIIRKQEIGNGRGIISTEYNENIRDAENNILNLPYEEIATKLDVATKSVVINDSTSLKTTNEIWVENGRFAWKKVPRANAYKIFIEKIGSNENYTNTGSYTETIISTSTDENEYFDMPENIIYNESGYVYRITITATHLERDNKTISPNYFEGENVITDAYARATIPDNLKVNKTGTISWNENNYYDSVEKFEIKVNENSSSTTKMDKTTNNSYDLSSVDFGTFDFSIRSLGKTDGTTAYLNSCYNPALTITKLTDPVLEIVNGTVKWGTDTSAGMGEQPTKTEFKLSENHSSNYLEEDILDETIGSYILHTEITEFDANYTPVNEYSATEYKFEVKYQGTEKESISNSDIDRQIIIASGIEPLVATKLPYPTDLSSVDVFKGNISENRIRWNRIENAGGYRALIITRQNDKVVIFDITETKIVSDSGISYQTNISIYEDGIEKNQISSLRPASATDDDYYFEYDESTGTVDLRLNKVIKALDLDSTNGLALDVYVQAIGSLNVTSVSLGNKFISSSFSERKKVEIPPMPTGMAFDSSTGKLSWQTDTSAGHNARITMTYQVNNVSEEDFDNYWKKTADVIKLKNNSESTITANNSANRFSEITSRKVEYEINSNEGAKSTSNTYTIYVEDIVFINAILDANSRKQTPTSYQVTNIGTNYNFTVRILTGDEDYDGEYMSEEATLSSTNNKPINFQAFEYGDGSEKLPYGIKNYAMFNSIRYYPSAYFELIDNISFKDTTNEYIEWKTIEKFSGSIDGAGYSVEYLKPTEISVADSASGEISIYKAIIKDNLGTIKNLNLTVNNVISGTITNSTIYVAGLAVTNSGTIDNVHITTFDDHISAKVKGTLYSTNVAGLVNINTGTISNSSVQTSGTIVALDENVGNLKSTYVAGLVNTNTGTIDKSYFSGNLQGNIVGGLVNENGGTISNSYSLGKALVTDTGLQYTKKISATTYQVTSDVVGKGVSYGGIAVSVYGNANITNCYSRMAMEINIKSTSEIIIKAGGIVGTIDSKIDMENNITIANCYTVFTATYCKENITVNDITTSNESSTGTVTDSFVYAIAPYESSVTYTNNYFLVESPTGATNISTNNSDAVAKNAGTLEELRNLVTAITVNGENIYYLPTRDVSSVEKTSLYPMLKVNCEENFKVQ